MLPSQKVASGSLEFQNGYCMNDPATVNPSLFFCIHALSNIGTDQTRLIDQRPYISIHTLHTQFKTKHTILRIKREHPIYFTNITVNIYVFLLSKVN